MEHQIFIKITRFVKERLTPGQVYGLHLSVGLLLLVVAMAGFSLLAEAVMAQQAITVLDVQLAHRLHALAQAPAFDALTRCMLAISLLHTGVGMVTMVVALGYYFWRVQARDWLLALLVAAPSGALLNVALKTYFQRVRPVFDEPLVSLATYSFPSGHAASATLFYGLLASYLVSTRPHWRVRLLTLAACSLMVVWVAASRVYLGAHYLSDVLAAMAESVAWLALCITVISTLRRRAAAAHPVAPI